MSADRPGCERLGRSLSIAGILPPDWQTTFDAVDRAQFLPDVMWPWGMTRRASVPIDKTLNPEAWYAATDSDQPIVTQWDDGRHAGTAPGKTATSSSSLPSVVYRLLHELDVDAGMNVLDVGTGTGETAGALTHRCGQGNVTTVEVDPAISRHAKQRLQARGLDPTIAVGDGAAGYRPRAPYHRIFVTFGLHQTPGALIEQTRPGSLIVAPRGTHYSRADAIARLRVTNGTASGHFTAGVEFMKSRAQRRAPVDPRDY
ncbi:methyltransferase domain-containing protein [Streptomyces sp. RGM 3693]|uniref:methyltransferase domain-containing protein n=1 Tax=Streptomyces sp. RGM 3693 TaxID=3413284 RepID=UPI003D276EB8